ncbi:uncharacterized protein LOC128206531 isoform X2 [Mya arenaria]|uniref:uncharacterized protein LOC128206531 isoform X2 n=1 Tax=Mya arenaria TaxID=6604 RepID=UPI0022DF11EB|nr:uncharacterized protein LOC128206531 isoform X2 [Mya arenaria]
MDFDEWKVWLQKLEESQAKVEMAANTDEAYFQSYSSLNVHELMIKDKPRTEAYKEFLEENVHLIKGKTVLDVGAGSGILSLFAARCGAKKVYAVEASDVAKTCKEVVERNKYDNVITVVKGRIEDIDLSEKVDVIISEWMGFYLLHESMLDSVIYARDKWLKPDGIILPSHASIYACPVNMSEFCKENFEYWEDVYGFDFSPFQEQAVAAHLQQPAVTCLKEDQLLAEFSTVLDIDLKTVKINEVQELEEKFEFKITQNSILHGFAFWFNVRFDPVVVNDNLNVVQNVPNEHNSAINGKSSEKSESNEERTCKNRHVSALTLDTSPFSEATHWKQTVCFLPSTVAVEREETIFIKVSLSQDSENKRHYNISLEMLESLNDTDNEIDDDDDDLEEDTSRHPIPCDCGSGRCRIISAIIEKYDEEQTELEMEAEFTDVSAEVQAAQSLDNENSYIESDSTGNEESLVKDK